MSLTFPHEPTPASRGLQAPGLKTIRMIILTLETSLLSCPAKRQILQFHEEKNTLHVPPLSPDPTAVHFMEALQYRAPKRLIRFQNPVEKIIDDDMTIGANFETSKWQKRLVDHTEQQTEEAER